MANFAGDQIGAEYINFKAIPQPRNAPDGTMWFDVTTDSVAFLKDGLVHYFHMPLVPSPDTPLIYKTTINTSQLTGLSTTPRIIIPTGGPNTVIVPQYFSFQLNVVNAFSIANGGAGNTVIYWAGLGRGSNDAYSLGVFADVGNGGNGINYIASQSQLYLNASYTQSSLPLPSIVNQPVMVAMDDALSGGAGNSMLITISYVIVTV
jgi:hypothetical protein